MNPLHGVHRLPVEFPRPLQIQVAVDAVTFYAESYEVVATILGIMSEESAAAKAWLDSGETEADPAGSREDDGTGR